MHLRIGLGLLPGMHRRRSQQRALLLPATKESRGFQTHRHIGRDRRLGAQRRIRQPQRVVKGGLICLIHNKDPLGPERHLISLQPAQKAGPKCLTRNNNHLGPLIPRDKTLNLKRHLGLGPTPGQPLQNRKSRQSKKSPGRGLGAILPTPPIALRQQLAVPCSRPTPQVERHKPRILEDQFSQQLQLGQLVLSTPREVLCFRPQPKQHQVGQLRMHLLVGLFSQPTLLTVAPLPLLPRQEDLSPLLIMHSL